MDYLKKAKDELLAEVEKTGDPELEAKAEKFVNEVESHAFDAEHSGAYYESEFMTDRRVVGCRPIQGSDTVYIRLFVAQSRVGL